MQQNAFVQSMKTIAESFINTADYDKTRNGKIIGVNEVTNTYTVKIDGLVYNNVKIVNDMTCRVGDTVKVKIPMNNPSQMYIMATTFSPDSLGKKLIQVNTLAQQAEDQITNIGRVLGELYQLSVEVSYALDPVLSDGSQMAIYTATLKHITSNGIIDVTNDHLNELHWYLENPSGRGEYIKAGYLSSPGKTIQVGSKYYLYGQSIVLEWRTNNVVNLVARVTLFNNELITEQIQELSDATSIAIDELQYFWFDGDTPSSTDKGAHITFLPKVDFQSNPTYGGTNLFATAQGIAIREGLQELVGMYYDGFFVNTLINNAWKNTIFIGSDNNDIVARIGALNDGHTLITKNGMEIFMQNDTDTPISAVSVAEFGETARVGLESGNNVKVVSDGVVINYEGEAAAKFSVDENGYSFINLGEESDSSTGLSVYGNIEGYVNADESLLRIINYHKPTSSGTNSFALHFSDVDRDGKAIASMSATAAVGSSYHWAYVRAISDQTNGSKVWLEADAIQIDGDTVIDGELKVEGHSSPIGDVRTGIRTPGAGTVGTSYSTVATIELPKGVWLITAFNSFNGGTAGVRRVLITSSSSATTDAATGSSSSYAAVNNQIVVRSSLIVQPSNTTTYYMRCKSGNAQVDSPYGNMTAVRIA